MNTPTSLLLQAAEQAAGGQQYPAGALYVVATPIGNRADLSLRAIHVLARADRVACEDTRVGGSLLQHLGLHKPLLALHQHNEAEVAARLLQHLAAGERVALITDAGTPAVSDPGARVVAAVVAAGHPVVPIPGPSSALAALCVAGDPFGRRFTVHGFLPARGRERDTALATLLAPDDTQLVFEAPHRMPQLAAELAAAEPARRLTLGRELTKQFETIVQMNAAELPAWLEADPNRLRGEFVLVLHTRSAAPTPDAAQLPAAARHALTVLRRELPLAQAASLTAALTGVSRKHLYRAALDDNAAAAAAEPADPADDSADDPA